MREAWGQDPPAPSQIGSRTQHPLSEALTPTPAVLGTPIRDPGILALTGDVELHSLLHGHTSCREHHLTGEAGAMVLGPWGEGEHRGVAGPGVQGGQGSRRPEEDGGRAPLTGPRNGTGHLAGAAGLQGPRDANVGREGERWRTGRGTGSGGRGGVA